MTHVLQAFLDQSLLESISSDDDFKNLIQAAQALSKALLEERPALLSSTITVLDPGVSENHSDLRRAEEHVKGHWNTFRNRFHGGATFALRAVIFEALAAACEESAEAAATVWYAGGSRLRHIDHGEVGDVCEQLFIVAGEKTEAAARELWSLPAEPEIDTIPNVKFDASEVKSSGIDQSALQKGLQKAAVPNDASGKSMGGNRYWPHQNNNSHVQNWGEQFSKLAAEAIAETVGSPNGQAVAKLSEKVESALRSHSHSIRRAIRSALKDTITHMKIQELKSELMWWMRTRYSPLLRCSYRDLPLPSLLLTMALDLHRQVPVFAPQSVEYLLREFVREMSADDESVTMDDFLGGLSRGDVPSELMSALDEAVPERKGQPTTPGLAQSAVRQQSSQDIPQDRISDISLTAPDLAVWLYRDLQAERLAASA